MAIVADLHDPPALDAAVRRVLEQWGRIDVLVNNAVDTGPGSMVPFVDLTIEQLERKLFANCRGAGGHDQGGAACDACSWFAA